MRVPILNLDSLSNRKSPHLKPTQYSATALGVDRSAVSYNAISVIEGLQSAGFDGYLVGGCVRDLLMGKLPKDFDVTTNASPEEVRGLFSRSRIIGRRFRLVHVTYGRGREREIIEVATYRAKPDSANKSRFKGSPKASKSGRILDDNVYGTIEADAIRRDFTINALYYDPIAEIVVDFVNGIEDAKSRTLKIIGDANTRFAEDPVRMLRVIRFQGKLDLNVEPSITAAIARCGRLLEDVPAARLFDEVLKMFHHAAAVKSWKLLRQTSLLGYLFDQTLQSIEHDDGDKFESLIISALNNTDIRVGQGKPVIAGYMFAVLLWAPFLQELARQTKAGVNRNEAFWSAGEVVFKHQTQSVSIPYRVRSPANEIWEMQTLLENRRPKHINRLLENRRFRAAYDFLLLRQEIGEVDKAITDWWTTIQECGSNQRGNMIDELRKHPNSSQPGQNQGDKIFPSKKKNRSRQSKNRRRFNKPKDQS